MTLDVVLERVLLCVLGACGGYGTYLAICRRAEQATATPLGDSYNQERPPVVVWGAWERRMRCVHCGAGPLIIMAPGEVAPHPVREDFLCPGCGSARDTFIPWIGRAGKNAACMEWVPYERLPEDLRARIPDRYRPTHTPKGAAPKLPAPVNIEQEVQRRLDAEFDRRVEAAVAAALEVERAALRAREGAP